MKTILLLLCSNIFMTMAWYGHLKFKTAPLFVAILASWGIAFAEYCFQVPANRAGYGQLDFSARYKLLKGITATVDVLNVLNSRRYEWVYDPSLTDGLFTSGRTVQFSLRASF